LLKAASRELFTAVEYALCQNITAESRVLPPRHKIRCVTTLHRVAFAGFELEYQTSGAGEHVVLIHHGAGADWFTPLLEEQALTDRFCLVHYHRAGYAGSSPLTRPLTFEREAATFREFMRALDITRAHIVGHSASGCLALQIAIDLPDIVHSLAVLEPALMVIASPPDVPRAVELYNAGDRTGAVDTFLRATCGPDAQAVLERVLPGAREQALVDADTFFSHELPALRQWSFGPNEASRVKQPVLAVSGEHSDSRFHQRNQLLLEWLLHGEPFMVANAGHLLHLENPGEVAAGLAAFFSNHWIGTAA
jgi:pimeloyl-ACP methyl ester carboxylesterase